jgi:hypothetical protein
MRKPLMPDQFETLIEARLKAELAPLAASATPPAAGSFLWLAGRRGLTGLNTTRTALFALAVALGLAGGLIAATAFTGSTSPRVWTRQVEAVVSQCKVVHDQGEGGIGHCADDGIATATQSKSATAAPAVMQPAGPAAPERQAPVVSVPGIVQAAPPAAAETTGSGAGTETQTGGGIGHRPGATPTPTPK